MTSCSLSDMFVCVYTQLLQQMMSFLEINLHRFKKIHQRIPERYKTSNRDSGL
jgi:hypothetical protein